MSEAPLMPHDQVAHLSLREAALVYARAGLAVFPCWPGSKKPATTHGYREATIDLERVGYWWRRNPQANIGVTTGTRVDVLDIDVHAGGTGFGALQRLLDAGLAREWAHAVRSPSGGLHLYYPADPDRPQRSWSRSSAHIDFRGQGGYVITVPSRITIAGDERVYEPVGQAFRGRPIPADRIRELLSPSPPARRPALSSVVASLEEHALRIGAWLGHSEGSDRNEALFWAACRLAELGASEHDTWAYLAEPADRIGLSHRETLATIRNAHRVAIPDLASTHHRHTATYARPQDRP